MCFTALTAGHRAPESPFPGLIHQRMLRQQHHQPLGGDDPRFLTAISGNRFTEKLL